MNISYFTAKHNIALLWPQLWGVVSFPFSGNHRLSSLALRVCAADPKHIDVNIPHFTSSV